MSVIYSPVLIRDNLYLPCIKNRYNDFSKRIFRRKGKITGNTTTAGKSTIGVFEEGEYTFGTSTHETMIVIEGELMAQIPV